MFNLPQSVDLNKAVKQINGIRIDRLAQLIERNTFVYILKTEIERTPVRAQGSTKF